ncbi:hypothetical protein DV737_g2408, partial [Chaetothyriales sp. CBS 132003]
MASYVYFKFKSQKEPQRVTIDGPHTDVWNLKREIIQLSRLGDGTDFDLKIYKDNSDEEYTDDTEIIPKDSTVLARRLPASAPGKGRAARYVSGKPPVSAKASAAANTVRKNVLANMDKMTEQERLQAMFKLQDAQWQQTQENMSHETRVPLQGGKPMKRGNVPEGEPPHGYICYRCGKKGHWIQACPTNDDANYDNKNRIKRTTGIPRSMLKKIDQADIDKLDDEQRQHLMVNAEGEYVFAQADEKAWKRHLEQVEASKKAAQKTENISLEGLIPDEGVKQKIKDYQDEKANEKQRSQSPGVKGESDTVSRDVSKSPTSATATSKKRTADEASASNSFTGPSMKRQKSNEGSAVATPQPGPGDRPDTPGDDSASKQGDVSENGTTEQEANNLQFDPSMMPPDFSQMQAMMSQMNGMGMMNPMMMNNPMMMQQMMMNMSMNPMMMGMMGNGMVGMNALDDILPANATFPIPEDGEFVVYGKVYTDPAHADDVEALYTRMTVHAQHEEGIIYYSLSRDLDDRRVFHFFERYASKEAFERHNETELVQKLVSSGWMMGVSARFGKPIGKTGDRWGRE